MCDTYCCSWNTSFKKGDRLFEYIKELGERLNVCVQQIYLVREEARQKLNIQRQHRIDQVEFAEEVQVIEFRKDHFTDLENEPTQRLINKAKQP